MTHLSDRKRLEEKTGRKKSKKVARIQMKSDWDTKGRSLSTVLP